TTTTSFCRALTNGVVLSGSDTRKFTLSILQTLIDAKAPLVTDGHIECGWLGGKVIAPRKKDLVFPALCQIAPKISTLITPEFDKAYSDYVSTRQQIMRAVYGLIREEIAKRQGGNGKKKNIERAPLNESIKLIVDHLLRKMDDLWGVTVLSVEEIGETKLNETQGKRSLELEKAIMRSINDPKIEKKSRERMYLECQALLPIVNRIIHEFMRRFFSEFFNGQYDFRNVSGRTMSPAAKGTEIIGAAFGLNPQFYRRIALGYRERMKNASIKGLEKFFPADNIEILGIRSELEKQLLSRFKNDLYKGTLDRYYGCKEGTLENMFKTYYELEGILLIDHLYSTFLLDIIRAKMGSQIGKQLGTKAERAELDRTDMQERKIMEKAIQTISTPAFLCAADEALGFVASDPIYAGWISPMGAIRQFSPAVANGIEMGLVADDSIVFGLLREMEMHNVIHIYPRANERISSPFSHVVELGIVNIPKTLFKI
ncbi:hypothetical protein KJ780_01535, partial [Candidatus Micrarchaeota archaeon]|nr:hypothetical protein [Candidatus Micrarchaeota archaeon]